MLGKMEEKMEEKKKSLLPIFPFAKMPCCSPVTDPQVFFK